MRFRNKTIVITGAGAGIGRALLEKFIGVGAFVAAFDIDEEELKNIKTEFGDHCSTHLGNVTNLAELTQCRDEVLALRGQIDIWFNNAGIAGLGKFMDQSLEDFTRVVDINLFGVVYGTRVALESMEDQVGTIVNMASIAGILPAPMMSAYNASKHAVVGFSRSLAQELKLGQSKVDIVIVCPGFVETAIINKGGKHGFPEWASFMLSKPESVVNEILSGLKKGRKEIYPTFNGKLMRRLYKLFPDSTVNSSKLLFAKSVKDALLNRYGTEDRD